MADSAGLDAQEFAIAEGAIRAGHKLARSLKRKRRALRVKADAATEAADDNRRDELLARLRAVETRLNKLAVERDEQLEVVAQHANAAFNNLALLNEFLHGLRLPIAATPTAAVQALKKARVHINIYDVVSRAFNPVHDTVRSLGRSIDHDGRKFPLALAKAGPLKLFLRKVSQYFTGRH